MSWCDELHHWCRRCDHWPRQAKIVRQISQTNHLRHVHHSLVLAGADGGGRSGRGVREPGQRHIALAGPTSEPSGRTCGTENKSPRAASSQVPHYAATDAGLNEDGSSLFCHEDVRPVTAKQRLDPDGRPHLCDDCHAAHPQTTLGPLGPNSNAYLLQERQRGLLEEHLRATTGSNGTLTARLPVVDGLHEFDRTLDHFHGRGRWRSHHLRCSDASHWRSRPEEHRRNRRMVSVLPP